MGTTQENRQSFSLSISPKLSPTFSPVLSPTFPHNFSPTFSPNCSHPNSLLICLPLFSCTLLPIQFQNYWPVTRFNKFQGSSSQLFHMQELVFGLWCPFRAWWPPSPHGSRPGREARQGRKVNTWGSLRPRVDWSLSGAICNIFFYHYFFLIFKIRCSCHWNISGENFLLSPTLS